MLIFSMEKERRFVNWEQEFYTPHKIISKRTEDFVGDRMSYIVLRGCLCNMIVLNVHVPSEEKIDNSKDSFYEELEQVFKHFPKYHMEILLGYFNAKMGRENIFNPTVGNGSLHQASNDSGVRIVNFATSKNLAFKNMMLPHLNIHKYTWTSPDGKTHNQVHHTSRNRRWHSSILDVRRFRGDDCDTDHYLVVAKVTERFAVSKQTAQKFEGERFNLRKLNELEVRKQYQIEVCNSGELK